MLSASCRRRIAATLLACFSLQTTGCHTWRVSDPGAVIPESNAPDRYRVTRTDGTRIEATIVKVVGDTLYARGGKVTPQGEWMAIARREVLRVDERHGDAVKTAALVLGIIGVAVLTVYAAARATEEMIGAAVRGLEGSASPAVP